MPQSARDVRLSHRCSQPGSEDEVVTAGEGATFHAEPPQLVGKRGRNSNLPTPLCLRWAAPGGSVRLVESSVDHNRWPPSLDAYVLPGQSEGFADAHASRGQQLTINVIGSPIISSNTRRV